ncbi:MAG: hypothetical protein ACREBH_02375 [Candidatus Micrarchaeaceae archaeon]
MDEEGVMYLAFCLVILLGALAALPTIGRGIAELLALGIVLLGAVAIVLLNFADFLVVSLVCGFLDITFQPALGYKINKNQNAIVKNVSGLFYATGYVTANLYAYTFKQETQESELDEKMITAPENWERAIMNIGFPFKYHVLSMGLDVQKVRDEYEGKRSYEEFQLSRALQSQGTSDVTITNIQRKINILQRKIDRISQGEKPVATIMYLETTAIGVSEKASLDALSQQINGLQIALSSMDVDLSRVLGREMYTLFNFNFSLPLTLEKTASLFDQQS